MKYLDEESSEAREEWERLGKERDALFDKCREALKNKDGCFEDLFEQAAAAHKEWQEFLRNNGHKFMAGKDG